MGISFHIWALVLALALVLVGYFAYRRTTPEIPLAVRVFLTSLRVVAFLLIVLLLMDPRYVFHSERHEPARVIAAIDQSASMSLPSIASSNSRFETAKALSQRLGEIVKSGDAKYEEVFFSGDLLNASPDTIAANGQGTDITRSLGSIHRRYDGENIAAIVLLTDGVETTNRLVRREIPPVPVFAVGLGDTSAPEDVRIKDVDYNSIVRAPSRSSISASLHYSGAKNKRVEVRLRENGQTVFRKDTLFTPQVSNIDLEIPVEFPEPGRRTFVLDAVVEGYDAEAENNRRDVVIEAEKAGVRVLIVDLLPEWELHFLTEFLRNDQTFDFDLVSDLDAARDPSDGRLESPKDFVDKLGDYDALVLVSVTDAFMSTAVTNAIKKFVETDGKGLLVLPGHSSLFESAAAWARLSDLLPVQGAPPHRFNLRFTSVRPGAQAGTNPITAQLVPLLSQTDWQQRSPLLGYYTSLAPKTGVEVLLETDAQRLPVFTYQVVGKGRVALVSVGPLWRWKFLSEGNTMYDEMVSRLLDVLSRGEDTERFVLFSKKNVYDSGEAPTITAELFDEKMQPVTGVPVRLEISRIEDNGSEVPLDIVAMQRDGVDNPRYKVEIPPLVPGNYRLRAEAELSGHIANSQSVDISVSEVSVEFQHVAQDRSNLATIAGQTRGGYAAAASAEALVRGIRLDKRIVASSAEITLRTSLIVFGLILALLALEWIVRKRLGMV